jgi:CHAT domain-containing protein
VRPEVRHVVIVPDGILSGVPFEILAPDGGAPILVERAAVTYLPSAALLFRTRPPHETSPPWRRQLTGFGDPIVNAAGAFPSDQQWSRLPESARELRSIAALMPGASRTYTGLDDLKRHLVQGNGGATPLLHISTHAVADNTDPNRSRIVFTPEPGKRGSEYLFRGEVQALAFGGVDLVTLSACDTEGGAMTRGEGLQSFSRAFLAAGARSTVTTLWRVADGPTADFMQIFYQRLARGETKAEALRGAKLEFLRMRDERALPVYWAAFVLNGDGQSAIPPVYSWKWVLAPAVLLVSIAVLTFRWARRRAR